MKTSIRPDDRPVHGDVLITSERGIHFLSVVPYPHRLSFATLSHATEIANQWAKVNQVRVWHQVDGMAHLTTKRTV